MKKYELILKENEEMVVDVDDSMETELAKFKETIKDLNDAELTIFDNWVKIYKLLNYDIIDGLSIDEVYKFNEFGCVIELTFRGKKEFDFLNLNPNSMTVACMNVKNDSIRQYTVRRLLIPNTVEEALAFAKSMIPKEGLNSIANLVVELQSSGIRYNITNQIKLNDNSFIRCPEFKEDIESKREDPRADFTYSYCYKRKEEPKIDSTYAYCYKKAKPKQEKQIVKQQLPKQPKVKINKTEQSNHTIDGVMNSIQPDGKIDLDALLEGLR